MEKRKAMQIKFTLLEKGISQTSIAKELNVTDGFISLAINGKRKSKKFDCWVEKNLGVFNEQ